MGGASITIPAEVVKTFQDMITSAVVAALSQMRESQHSLPERINVDRVTELTGLSKNTVYQMHSRGQIPGAEKIRGKLMFNTSILQDWIAHGGKDI